VLDRVSYRRAVPVTTKSHAEQTSRSRQSSAEVSAPYRATTSVGSAPPDAGRPCTKRSAVPGRRLWRNVNNSRPPPDRGCLLPPTRSLPRTTTSHGFPPADAGALGAAEIIAPFCSFSQVSSAQILTLSLTVCPICHRIWNRLRTLERSENVWINRYPAQCLPDAETPRRRGGHRKRDRGGRAC